MRQPSIMVGPERLAEDCEPAASPPDVRKAFGLPDTSLTDFGLRPGRGEAPNLYDYGPEAQSASAHQTAKPNPVFAFS
jgi:hypothetical protein